MKKNALIVAAGIGSRMNSSIPKQFLLLNGKPLLMHTIEAFSKINDVEIYVVINPDSIQIWKNLCAGFSFPVLHKIIEGGETRFHSVKNGLEKINDSGLVAIHDGVRPIISKEIIEKSFEIALQKGNAITSVKLKDSIREKTLTGITKNVNRNNYYLIQTPQTFKTELIKKAYENATHYNFTDEASVLEEVLNVEIHLTDGDYKNIKITTPEDFQIASVLLSSNENE